MVNMETLPPEILEYIFAYCGGYRFVISQTCQRWREFKKDSSGIKFLEYLIYFDTELKKFFPWWISFACSGEYSKKEKKLYKIVHKRILF